jgi:glutaminase
VVVARAGYVSTGHLPSPRQVQSAVDEAYRLYRSDDSGENSPTYPALARVTGNLFGICVAGTSGSVYRAGDTGYGFAIMSVAKPFAFALVCDALGANEVRHKSAGSSCWSLACSRGHPGLTVTSLREPVVPSARDRPGLVAPAMINVPKSTL